MKHNETHAAVSKISLPVDSIRDNINNEGSVNPDTRQLTPSTASQSRGKHFAHDPAYAGNNYTQLIRSFWFSFSFFLVRACVRARWYNLEKYATVTTLVRERTSPAVITIQNIPSRCRADDRALNSSYYTNSLCHGQPNTTKTCLLIHIYSSPKNRFARPRPFMWQSVNQTTTRWQTTTSNFSFRTPLWLWWDHRNWRGSAKLKGCCS